MKPETLGLLKYYQSPHVDVEVANYYLIRILRRYHRNPDGFIYNRLFYEKDLPESLAPWDFEKDMIPLGKSFVFLLKKYCGEL